jgi:hypothetical protein
MILFMAQVKELICKKTREGDHYEQEKINKN